MDIPFKWQDFASSVNFPCVFSGNVAEGWRTYQDISPQMRIAPLSPILEVCPFFIRPAALLRALCYDGRLRMEEARTAAQALEALDCFQPNTVYQLQKWSAEYRANRDKLGQIIQAHAGRYKEFIKNIVKKIAFAVSPRLKNFADSIACYRDHKISKHNVMPSMRRQ